MTDFTRKVFRVTMDGIDWNGKPATATKMVETFGDAEQAKYIVIKQDFPSFIRKVETWTVERVA